MNDYIYETSDLEEICYFMIQGYVIKNIRIRTNKGKSIISFILYEHPSTIMAVKKEYKNSDVYKSNEQKRFLLSLIRNSNNENLLEKING